MEPKIDVSKVTSKVLKAAIDRSQEEKSGSVGWDYNDGGPYSDGYGDADYGDQSYGEGPAGRS